MKQAIHGLLLAASTAAALAPAAHAQAPSEARKSTLEDELETVVVTATKRSEYLSEIPQSIQALSGERLVSEGVSSFSDIVQIVPGTSQTWKASPGFEILQIRGVSAGAVGDALVGYYIDEIPFSIPNVQYIPPVEVFDVARVEVLRGPQGTLYGQSAMGGAIRLITNRPDLTSFGGEVRLGYMDTQKGGAGGYKVDAMLNAPLSSTFGIRLTGGTSDIDSYIANTGPIKSDNGRLKALWAPNDELSIEGTAWIVRVRQEDYYYGQPTDPYNAVTDPNQPRGVDTDADIFNVTVNYALPFADLVSASSYVDHKFGFVFALPGLFDLLPGAGPWLHRTVAETESFSQELRLASRDDQWLKWIGGVFFQDAKVHRTMEQGWRNYAPLNLGPSVWTAGVATFKSDTFGVFGEISHGFANDTIIPTLGLRYYRNERTVDDRLDGVFINPERTFTSWNPRFNLAYKPTDGSLYYLNAAKGFRSGAFQSQTAVDVATGAGLPASVIMPQDSLWSYEVGGKWNTGDLTLEVAVYYIDWKDAQITNLIVGPSGVVTTTVISGGNDVEGKGIDFGLAWATPVEGLSVQLAGNYNQTEFTRVPPNTIARKGAQIPGAPKSSATLALNYDRPVGALTFTANASYNYRGEQSELTTGEDSDSLRDLRLRLGLGQESWDVSVYGTNLTDQEGVSAILSTLVVNPVQPRTLGLDVNFRF